MPTWLGGEGETLRRVYLQRDYLQKCGFGGITRDSAVTLGLPFLDPKG